MGTLAEDLTKFAVSTGVGANLHDRARLAFADTFIAILSAQGLPPGRSCIDYANERASKSEGPAREFATLKNVTMEDAAFINATLAHGDETDDSLEVARMHPGCAIIPTATAVAEALNRSFGELLDAAVVGYDLGAAVNLSTWNDRRTMRLSVMSVHHIGGLFGAVGAVLRLRRVSTEVGRRAIGYAVQHAGGVLAAWADPEHTEKAVTLGGLPARSALFSCDLADLGFSTCTDPFSGSEGFYAAFGVNSDPEVARERLREPGRAMAETSIKRYPVGMPIQAACEAVEQLVGYGQKSIPDSVLVELPAERVGIVAGREALDISLQYVLALQLTAGIVDFGTLHDLTPAPAAAIELAKRIELVGSTELDIDSNGFGTTLVARVTLSDKSGIRTKLVAWPTGSPRNPVGWDALEKKASEVLGACGWRADEAVEFVRLARTTDTTTPVRVLMKSIAAFAARASARRARTPEFSR